MSNKSWMECNYSTVLDILEEEFMYNSTHDNLKEINNGRFQVDFDFIFYIPAN